MTPHLHEPAYGIHKIQPAQFEQLVLLIAEMAQALNMTGDLRIIGDDREKAAVRQERMRAALFGPQPLFEALFLEINGEPAGFCTFHMSFSTYRGQAGLFLEDLYVCPPYRKGGYGQKLMAHLAQIARTRQCFRIVWNFPADDGAVRRFYTGLGAHEVDRRTMMLDGAPLATLASPSAG